MDKEEGNGYIVKSLITVLDLVERCAYNNGQRRKKGAWFNSVEYRIESSPLLQYF